MRKKRDAKVKVNIYLNDGRKLNLHYDNLSFLVRKLEGFIVEAIEIEKAILESKKTWIILGNF